MKILRIGIFNGIYINPSTVGHNLLDGSGAKTLPMFGSTVVQLTMPVNTFTES